MKIAISSDNNNPLMNCVISVFQRHYNNLTNNFIYLLLASRWPLLHLYRDVLEFAKAQHGTRHSYE